MTAAEAAVVRIDADHDVLVARQAAKRLALALGFAAADAARLEVVAAELGSNIVKHAGRGRLVLEGVYGPGGEGTGLRLMALDHGPGIADLAAALRPGTSTAGTLGDGLAAVRELVDEFAAAAPPGGGTRIEVTKWRR
jgi:serine/threonine-protein kinase RsbT